MLFILVLYDIVFYSSYSSNKSYELIFWFLGVWFYIDWLIDWLS